MMHLQRWIAKPGIGIFGGFLCWYTAHEVGIFGADVDCRLRWILTTVHGVTFVLCLACAWWSYQALLKVGKQSHGKNQNQIAVGDSSEEPKQLKSSSDRFVALISLGAAFLFALVIFWQAVAAMIYTGCER